MPALPFSRRRALVAGGRVAARVLALAGRHARAAPAARRRARRAVELVPERRRSRRGSSSCTSSARSAGPASTGCPRARASPTRSRARAARRAKADTALVNLAAPLADGMQVVVPSRGRRRGGPPAAAARRGRRSGPVHLNSATLEQLDALPGVGPVTAQKIVDYRAEHGRSARSTSSTRSRGSAPRGSRSCGSWWRRDRVRALADAAHALAPPVPASRAANWRRARRPGARAVGVRRAGARRGSLRAPARAARAAALAAARSPAGGGAAPGSTRSTAASLAPEIGRAGACARRRHRARRAAAASRCACPAEVRRFGARRVHEPVLLELPLGRAPPQGAILELVAEARRAARAARHGFDERAWLRRQGVHVVLRGGDWRIVGRRGGLGGVADRLRARLARAIAPGLERRAARACSRASCSARTRGSRRSCGTASGPPGSTTCSPSRARTSRSSPAACSCSPGCSACRGWLGEVARARGDRRLRARRRLAAVGRPCRASPARSPRWPGSPRGRATAGTSCSSARRSCSPGTRTTLLEPGFQLSFAAVAAIFVARAAARAAGSRATRCRAARATRSPSRSRAALATAPILWLQFGAVPRLLAARPTRSRRRRSRRCSGSALVGGARRAARSRRPRSRSRG